MKKLPIAARALLFPVTSFIDLLLLPNNVSKDFYQEARNFVGGLHVVSWIRLMFIPTLMLMFTLFETCIQEATLIANQLYQKQQFFDTKQVLDEWKEGSFTYDALVLQIFLSIFLGWLIVVTIMRRSILFVPMQWYGIWSLFRFVYRTLADQYYRIQNDVYIMRNMEQVKRDLRSLRLSAYQFPMISVPYEFAPLVRTIAELSVIGFMCFFVYVVERSMLYYGYEETLCKLYNRFFDNEKSATKDVEEGERSMYE